MNATTTDRKRIGRMLIDEGLIEPEHLRNALALQAERGGKIVDTLIHLGHIEFDAISTFLATRPGIASIELENYRVPPKICTLIPRDYALQHEVFPLDRMGSSLTVAMAFPLDSKTISQLEHMTELRVVALMCSPDDIRSAIRLYYPEPYSNNEQAEDLQERIETSLKLENVASMVRRVDTLPTLPETVLRVQQATTDPNSSLRDIAAIVSNDPPISARLLQIANSAAYGFLSQIDNVRSAITLLGMRETYMAVLSSAVVDLTNDADHFDHEEYWKRSMFCAAAARRLAAACGKNRKAGVFTAGLLSDIGRFALSELAPNRYPKIDQATLGQELVRVEEKALGITHAEAGHMLAVQWGLPEEIVQAIRFHHRPDLALKSGDMATIVALASVMTEAHARDMEPETSIFEDHSELLTALGLDSTRALEAYSAAGAPE